MFAASNRDLILSGATEKAIGQYTCEAQTFGGQVAMATAEVIPPVIQGMPVNQVLRESFQHLAVHTHCGHPGVEEHYMVWGAIRWQRQPLFSRLLGGSAPQTYRFHRLCHLYTLCNMDTIV